MKCYACGADVAAGGPCPPRSTSQPVTFTPPCLIKFLPIAIFALLVCNDIYRRKQLAPVPAAAIAVEAS